MSEERSWEVTLIRTKAKSPKEAEEKALNQMADVLDQCVNYSECFEAKVELDE